MSIEDLIATWNAQADEFNKWDSLDADERVNFALQQANKRAYLAANTHTEPVNTIPDNVRAREEFLDNFNA